MSKDLSQNREKVFQRCYYKSMGLNDENIEQPIIAILSCEGNYSPETNHMHRIATSVESGIISSNGNAVIIPISSLSNSISGGSYGAKYMLPSREIIADLVESLLISTSYDGVVLVANSEESIAGMLMGTIRVNIPTIVINGGPGEYRQMAKSNDYISAYSVIENMGKLKANKISLSDMQKSENQCDFDMGVGIGMHNVASLSCFMEALGIALPGNGSASLIERKKLALETGKTIIKLVEEAISPKMILTKDAFSNAFTVGTAVGVSTSSVLDLIAIANECNIELSYDNLLTITNKTPTLCKLLPYSNYTIKDFHKVGGVMTVMKELATKKLIKEMARTCTDKIIKCSYEDAKKPDEEIISYANNPLVSKGDIIFFKGNLAEQGGIAKRSSFLKDLKSFKGSAVCFDNEEDAVFAMSRGDIAENSAIVVRYEGPKGGPGMRELISASAVFAASELSKTCILITDGRLSSYTQGTAIGHLCPEAFEGSKLAIINNGDTIKVDISNGRVDVDLVAKEIQTRLKKLHPFDYHPSQYLLKYSKFVNSASKGAVLNKKY